MFEKPEIKMMIMNKKKQLEEVGINVTLPTADVVNDDTQFVVLTGSPKPHYATKELFLLAHPNLIDVGKLTDKRVNMLVTDDMSSTSSKMKDAQKKGIKIVTYDKF
jgi:hypothetical protein